VAIFSTFRNYAICEEQFVCDYCCVTKHFQQQFLRIFFFLERSVIYSFLLNALLCTQMVNTHVTCTMDRGWIGTKTAAELDIKLVVIEVLNLIGVAEPCSGPHR
jgi:hypothetical protein